MFASKHYNFLGNFLRKFFYESDGIKNSISTKSADSAVFHLDGRTAKKKKLPIALPVSSVLIF